MRLGGKPKVNFYFYPINLLIFDRMEFDWPVYFTEKILNFMILNILKSLDLFAPYQLWCIRLKRYRTTSMEIIKRQIKLLAQLNLATLALQFVLRLCLYYGLLAWFYLFKRHMFLSKKIWTVVQHDFKDSLLESILILKNKILVFWL